MCNVPIGITTNNHRKQNKFIRFLEQIVNIVVVVVVIAVGRRRLFVSSNSICPIYIKLSKYFQTMYFPFISSQFLRWKRFRFTIAEFAVKSAVRDRSFRNASNSIANGEVKLSKSNRTARMENFKHSLWIIEDTGWLFAKKLPSAQ